MPVAKDRPLCAESREALMRLAPSASVGERNEGACRKEHKAWLGNGGVSKAIVACYIEDVRNALLVNRDSIWAVFVLRVEDVVCHVLDLPA